MEVSYEVSITRKLYMQATLYQLSKNKLPMLIILAALLVGYSYLVGPLFAVGFAVVFVTILLLTATKGYARLKRITNSATVIQHYSFNKDKLVVNVPGINKIELYRKNASGFRLSNRMLYFRYNRRSFCVFLPEEQATGTSTTEQLRKLGWLSQ